MASMRIIGPSIAAGTFYLSMVPVHKKELLLLYSGHNTILLYFLTSKPDIAMYLAAYGIPIIMTRTAIGIYGTVMMSGHVSQIYLVGMPETFPMSHAGR
jgi:hypothetical protein